MRFGKCFMKWRLRYGKYSMSIVKRYEQMPKETKEKEKNSDGYQNCFVLRDIWFVSSTGQTCPEGRSTNRTRGPMRGAPPYPIQTRKTRPQHRELHALLFATSVRVLLRPTGLWTLKGCETGPPAYRPYPRRLESLTICRCNYKGSTFSSVI